MPAQEPSTANVAPERTHMANPSAPSKSSLDSATVPPVPKLARARPRLPAAREKEGAVGTSRQTERESPRPVLIQGDALTRYRLAVAWQLGRGRLLQATGSPARLVTVELAVVLAAGRAIAVEVVDDGGFAFLAARAAEQVRQASRLVPVPEELGEALLRVSLALRFEP
jgi:hypothetical protein